MKDAKKLGASEGSESQRERDVAEISEQWRDAHRDRARAVDAELSRAHAHAAGDERLLLRLAADDVALAETLTEAVAQLAHRLLAVIDNPRTSVVLAKALKEVSVCRTSAVRRAQELLQTAGTLRAQRRLVGATHLRSVA